MDILSLHNFQVKAKASGFPRKVLTYLKSCKYLMCSRLSSSTVGCRKQISEFKQHQ